MSKAILAYADEYGNNSFDFTTQGTHFIVAAVILKESEKESTEVSLEAIRKKYFHTGEIKSRKVGDNHAYRLQVLRELAGLNFNVYALVVDKEKLYGEGFRHKDPFYKYLSGLLYKELYKAYPKLRLFVDEQGDNDFLRSFKKYVYLNHIRDLFSGSEFETGSSSGSLLIQLADFIAGTLGRCFDRSKDLSHREKFLEVLEPRLSGLNYFPREFRVAHLREEERAGEHDNQVTRYATDLAIDFIETKEPKSQEDTDQINCVKLLLLHQSVFGAKRYLSASELIKHLEVGRPKPLPEQQFRATVIGRLRDQGLLIASSAKGEEKGYRLPTSVHDLSKFLDHGNGLILPILHRIQVCRERVKLATNNELDILNKEEFSKLTQILDNM
ncbi:DUF3800 domain-containing protein [Paraflavisolibacter sp. H34]|uniref:DUF3800 domain-containing protein n=1 Tax=Huijunlia imazamoxiresistens TaxID=3127457 RepID=UPI00301A63D3